MANEDALMETYTGVQQQPNPWEVYEKPFRYRRPWGQFPLNWGGGFPSVGLDFGGVPFGGALTGGESGFDASVPTQIGYDASGMTGGGFDFAAPGFMGDFGQGFNAGATHGGIGAPMSWEGTLSNAMQGAIPGYFSGAPYGKGLEGGVLGAASNLGGQFGGRFGQGITNALGLSPAPQDTSAMQGIFGNLGPAIQGVLATAANVASKGSPWTTIGIPALDAVIGAIRGQNISRDFADIMTLGIPRSISQIPVIGPFMRGMVTDPLASLINQFAQSVGLASPEGLPGAPAFQAALAGPFSVQDALMGMMPSGEMVSRGMDQAQSYDQALALPPPVTTSTNGDWGPTAPFANYGEGPAVPAFGLPFDAYSAGGYGSGMGGAAWGDAGGWGIGSAGNPGGGDAGWGYGW